MLKVKELILIGAANNFFEISEIIRAINNIEERYKIIGVLDDDDTKHGTFMNEILVLGSLNRVKEFDNVQFVFGIGSSQTKHIRHKIIEKLGIEESRFETIIHPTSIIDPSATIGNGCILHNGSFIGNNARLESFVTVAVNSAIGPFAILEAFSMITSLVVVLFGAKIGRSSFIGSNSCIAENVEIGKGSIVGAGTVISRNIPSGTFFLGNPCRMINKFEIPEDL